MGAVNPVGWVVREGFLEDVALEYGWDLESRGEAQQLKVPVLLGWCCGQVYIHAGLG